MLHASKEAVFKNPVLPVHPVGQLRREAQHVGMGTRRRGYFMYQNWEIGVFVVPLLDKLDCGIAVDA